MPEGCNDGCSGSEERVEDPVTGARKSQNEPFDQFNRELAWMISLFNMVALYVWNGPQITRILAKRVAGILTGFRAFEVLLTRVFLRDTDRIHVEDILVRPRKPQHYFIASRKPARTVEPMFKVPHDAIPHFQPQLCKNRVKERIQWNDRTILDVVADLPTNAAIWDQDSNTFGDDLALFSDILAEVQTFLVFLS